jgi:hypothetical protein
MMVRDDDKEDNDDNNDNGEDATDDYGFIELCLKTINIPD